MLEVGMGMKRLKNFPREDEALVSTEGRRIGVQDCAQQRQGEKRQYAHSRHYKTVTQSWGTGVESSGGWGWKMKSEPGKLTGYTHTELGFSPTDNGNQGWLLGNERHTVWLILK